MIAVRDDRIAVVRATAHEIELVAAARPHLDVPEPAFGIEREAADADVAEMIEAAGCRIEDLDAVR